MFTIKGCSLIRGVHYERFHCNMTFIRSFVVICNAPGISEKDEYMGKSTKVTT